jgi:hypothetical protein
VGRVNARCRRLVLDLYGDDLDAVLLELGPQGRKLFLLDLVRERKSLERRLVDGAQFLDFVYERARVKFSKIDQCYSSPFRGDWGARRGPRQQPRTGKNDRRPPRIPRIPGKLTGELAWTSGESGSSS